MNVLSLFDGMSCGQIALERIGVNVEAYYASEIDKDAIKVTQKNYPHTFQLNDVTKWRDWHLPKIDLLIGGSPCQGFSFAGKRLNFDDPRSKLFFEYVDILNELKPTYFLLENVKMKKEHQDVISQHLGVEPIEINSSLVSAQNRVRLYWTNIPGVGQPEDKGITWGDVRERGVSVERYYYTEKALEWIWRHGIRKNKRLKVHNSHEKMQMLEASHSKKYSSQRFFGILDDGIDNNIQKQVLSKMRDRYETLNSSESTEKSIIFPFESYEHVLDHDLAYRYITPLECERLQTVPDGYTDNVSATQRYRMLGNGWTVDVIAHILNGIK